MTGLRDGTPEAAGLSARHLAHACDLAAEWVKDGIHPAIVVLAARHGVIALHEAFGRLGPEPDDPALTRDALFPLASAGKPITATALMMLVEEGRVGLTRPVREYIPEFDGDGRENVFVHHLLTHTSGIAGPDVTEFNDEIMRRLEQPPRDATLHPIVDALLQMTYDCRLRTPSGEEMYYDSLNYELLGEIVRRVSGRNLPELVRDRIFHPLGMADSHLTVPPDLQHRVVRAKPESPMAIPFLLPLVDVPFAAGGVYSTARDTAVFGQAFLDGGRSEDARILGRATATEMTKNQIPGVPGVLDVAGFKERHDEASWGYGWGISCHEKWNYFPTPPAGTFSHAGLSGAYLWCDPINDVVGVCFAAMVNEIVPEQFWWQADLFANVINAAIED
jgi:CubicO group peptidase (beta-lactamase class C family)